MTEDDAVLDRVAVPGARVGDGLAALSPALLALRSELDRQFVAWAAEAGAAEAAYPPLMRVADLVPLDYFVNFPHLAVTAAWLRPEWQPEAGAGAVADNVASGWLADAEFVLPSAACFQVYNHLRGARLAETHRVTTVATCARRETHYDGLRRLLCFTMREIVFVGGHDEVAAHVATLRARVEGFAAALALPVDVRTATDPFFDPSASRAVMQRLFPTKEELVFGDDLAIASFNLHRNFFGERCGILLADGGPAFSGCVAFGLERWLTALHEHFGAEPDELTARVRDAAAAAGGGGSAP